MADCFITRRGDGELDCAVSAGNFSIEDVSTSTYSYRFNFSSYCTKAEIKMIVVTVIRSEGVHALGCYTNEGIEITSITHTQVPISVTVSDEKITIYSNYNSNGYYAKLTVIY